MNENDSKVVRVTNISNFDFTGELGARYAGRDFVIPAGKSMLFPYTIGKHLAKHLAHQILLRAAPIRDAKELDGRGSDRPLWDEQSLADLIEKIVSEVYEEEKPPVVSEGDRIAAKVADLNKVEKEIEEEAGGNVDASAITPVGGIDADGTQTPSSGVSDIIVYKDKAEVIAELNKRGVKYDARSSKAKLEDLLK